MFIQSDVKKFHVERKFEVLYERWNKNDFVRVFNGSMIYLKPYEISKNVCSYVRVCAYTPLSVFLLPLICTIRVLNIHLNIHPIYIWTLKSISNFIILRFTDSILDELQQFLRKFHHSSRNEGVRSGFLDRSILRPPRPGGWRYERLRWKLEPILLPRSISQFGLLENRKAMKFFIFRI